MTYTRIRNMELVCVPHTNTLHSQPETVLGLPVFEEPAEEPYAADDCRDETRSRIGSDPGDEAGYDNEHNGDEGTNSQDERTVRRSFPPLPSGACGVLPHSVTLEDVAATPPNATGRSMEARYAQQFLQRLASTTDAQLTQPTELPR